MLWMLLIPAVLIAGTVVILIISDRELETLYEPDYEIYELMEKSAKAKTRKEKHLVIKDLDRLCKKDLEDLKADESRSDLLNVLVINSASLHLLKGSKEEKLQLEALAALYRKTAQNICPAALTLKTLESFETENLELYRIVQAMKSLFSYRGILA